MAIQGNQLRTERVLKKSRFTAYARDYDGDFSDWAVKYGDHTLATGAFRGDAPYHFDQAVKAAEVKLNELAAMPRPPRSGKLHLQAPAMEIDW